MTSATDGTVNNVLQTLDPAEIERELLQHWARLQDLNTPIVQELNRFIVVFVRMDIPRSAADPS